MHELLRLFDLVGGPLVGCVFLTLWVLESKFALRRRVESRWRRWRTNAALATSGFLALRLVALPLVVWLALQNQTWHLGLFYRVSGSARWLLAFLLLDYSNYLWHRLNHRFPLLWGFHKVHHHDLDLDVSTAIRFHGGEVLLSTFFRAGVTLLSGAPALLSVVFEVLFEAATCFHHSNLRLPESCERRLNDILVTPRMHGIHHSVVAREADSNFSVIFTFWDRLHGTLHLDVPQETIIIGAPATGETAEPGQSMGVLELLKMPFQR